MCKLELFKQLRIGGFVTTGGYMTRHGGRSRRLSYTLAATAPPAQHALSSAC
jgi:hypothetical protein